MAATDDRIRRECFVVQGEKDEGLRHAGPLPATDGAGYFHARSWIDGHKH